MKQAYVHAMHGLGAGLYSSGMLKRDWAPMPAQGDLLRWLHSLFAIADIEAMVRMDLTTWSLSSAKLIERFLRQRPGAMVFEYGSGASSVFLAKRAEIVVTVEHDPDWHAVVTKKVAGHPNVLATLAETSPATSEGACRSDHAAYRDRDFKDYVEAIDRFAGDFDLIVIDGRCRAGCLEAALRRIKPDGLILFNNAARKRYRPVLEACSLAQHSAKGLTACLPYPDTTVLLSPEGAMLKALAKS